MGAKGAHLPGGPGAPPSGRPPAGRPHARLPRAAPARAPQPRPAQPALPCCWLPPLWQLQPQPVHPALLICYTSFSRSICCMPQRLWRSSYCRLHAAFREFPTPPSQHVQPRFGSRSHCAWCQGLTAWRRLCCWAARAPSWASRAWRCSSAPPRPAFSCAFSASSAASLSSAASRALCKVAHPHVRMADLHAFVQKCAST